MTDRDYVMLGDDAYDSATGQLIEFPGNRVRIKTASPPKFARCNIESKLGSITRADDNAAIQWRPMDDLARMTPGTRVRLDIGEHPLGPVVIGWRAVTQSTGPVYYTWDRSCRAHVTVTPKRWAPLTAVGPGVA